MSSAPVTQRPPASARARLAALRRCVLATSVIHDVDVEAGDEGALVPGDPPVLLPWSEVDASIAGCDPLSPAALRRLSRHIRVRRRVADAGGAAAALLREAARLVALPPGHESHPGPGWAQQVLPGGALDLGAGVQGLLDDPDEIVELSPHVARAAGVDVRDWWRPLCDHADAMGDLAMDRLERDRGWHLPVLRSYGGCDVLSLLASPTLRLHLAEQDSTGLCPVAVPTRSRGWLELGQPDPSFVAAAWAATDGPDRGLPRALLVTVDEVTLVRSPPER